MQGEKTTRCESGARCGAQQTWWLRSYRWPSLHIINKGDMVPGRTERSLQQMLQMRLLTSARSAHSECELRLRSPRDADARLWLVIVKYLDDSRQRFVNIHVDFDESTVHGQRKYEAQRVTRLFSRRTEGRAGRTYMKFQLTKSLMKRSGNSGGTVT
jgi:hypothetical protein